MSTDTAAKSIIVGAAGIAAWTGFVNPIPGGDLLILPGVWAGMLGSLAPVCGVEFDRAAFITAAKQVANSVGLYIAGYSLFVGITKLTGVLTMPAAFINAALNFGFTIAVGTMYRDAWQSGRAPTSSELEGGLKNTADRVKKNLDRPARRALKVQYDELRRSGISATEALTQVLSEFFGISK